MKLFNIFKKQKTRFITKELISLSSLANVPTIDYFKDNNQVLSLINLKKQEYLEILIKGKVLTSKDLKSNELHNKLKMIYSLIEQNTLGDELFEKVFFDEEDKVKALIKLRKFVIYNEQIKDLEEEIVSRIIALKEILKKTFLNKQKRISIINEINNLTNIFVILMNQKETLRLCLNNYGLKCFDITKERDLEKEKELISKRKEELNLYQMQAFGKIVYELNKLNDMAKVEVALEDYVYNYNWKDSSLRDKIIIFCKKAETDLDNQVGNFDQILPKILELENKLKIFYEFGNSILNKEDLKKVYQLKFKYYTIWKYENDKPILIEPFINEKTTKLELETYEEKIFELINTINSNQSTFFSLKWAFGENYLKVIRLLKKELQKELQTDGKYEPKEILNDKYKLNLLIAFSYPIETTVIKNIYKLIYVKRSGYPEVNFYEPEFTWNEDLPLETINELKLMQKQTKDLGLYLFLKKNYYLSDDLKEVYYMPEGLISIGKNYDSISDIPNHKKIMEDFVKPMRNNMEGKTVIFPHSLNQISNDFLGNTKIKELVLNENCRYCKLCPNTSKIIVPANIVYIDIPLKNTQELVFLDSEDSFLLHHKEYFQDFFQNFLYCKYTGERERDLDLAKYGFKIYDNEYMIKSNLQKIVFFINSDYVELPIDIELKAILKNTYIGPNKEGIFHIHSNESFKVASDIYDKIQKDIFHCQDKKLILKNK